MCTICRKKQQRNINNYFNMSFIYDHRGFKAYVFVFSNEFIT